MRSPQLHKQCRLDNSLVSGLVAEFNAMDLKHEISDQADDKKPNTERTVPASIPFDTVTTVLPKPRLSPPTAGQTSGSSIPAMNLIFPDRDESHDSDEDRFENDEYGSFGRNKGYGYDSDDHSDQDQDFTACSADDCGYCGKCMY